MGKTPPGRTGQRSIPDVKPELLALVPNEIQCREDRLVGGESQTASELLQKDRRALGGPQEKDGVNAGQIEALVEQVGGEDNVDASIAERPQRPHAVSLVGSSGDRCRWDPGFV